MDHHRSNLLPIYSDRLRRTYREDSLILEPSQDLNILFRDEMLLVRLAELHRHTQHIVDALVIVLRAHRILRRRFWRGDGQRRKAEGAFARKLHEGLRFRVAIIVARYTIRDALLTLRMSFITLSPTLTLIQGI
jgi:hypothetical protein